MSLKNFMSYDDAATVLGEYADKVNELKSGLTNVADDVKLNTQDLTTPSRTVNLYNKNDEYLLAYINTDNGVLHESTGATVVWIKCKPNTTYTVSKQARTNFMVATTRVKPAVGVQTYGYIVDYGGSSITITTDANAVYLVAYVYANSDQPTTRAEMLATVQIEEGSTATSYTPYIPSVESRLNVLERDIMTSLGSIAETEYVTFPASAREFFIRANINNYYFSPIYKIDKTGAYNIITFSVQSWACSLNISIDTTNNKITFASETTISGTKAATWTTNVSVSYR